MNHDKGQHFYLSSGLMIIHRVGRSFRSLFLRVQPSYSRWYQICAGNGYSVIRSLTGRDRTGSVRRRRTGRFSGSRIRLRFH
jgi:hypothetical protein